MTESETALQALTRLLREGDEADRCYCARALGNLGDTSAVPALAVCLQDEDIDVCIDAADALGRIGSPETLRLLAEALREQPDGEVGRAIAEALSRSPDPQAIEALVALASKRPDHLEWNDGWDYWWDMQLAAVEALGRHRASSAIPALETILDGDDAKDIEEQVLRALARIGGKGLDPIVQRLQDGSTQARRRAARALAASNSSSTARVLGRALQDAEPAVRIAAVESLAQMRARSYLKAAMLLLRDPEQQVRAAAAKAAVELARDGDDADLQQELLPMLDDPSPLVVRTALGVLESGLTDGGIGPELAAKALALLTHEDSEIAIMAIPLVGRSDTAEAGDGLLAALHDRKRPATMRRQAAIALGLRRPADAGVLDALAGAMVDSEQPVRLGALTALMSLEGAGDGEREPLNLVLDALAGRFQVPTPAEREIDAGPEETYSQVVEFEPDLAAEPSGKAASQVTEADTETDGERADLPATEEEVPLPETQEGTLALAPKKAAVSTLDAIAMDNTEAVLLFAEDPEDTPAVDPSDPEIKPFFDTLDENARVASMLFPDRHVSVTLDVQRLSARILAGSDSPEVVDGLLQALNNDDDEVRKAAAFSLETIVARNPDTPAVLNATGALIARLDIGESAVRAACARALAHLRNRSALSPLLEALEQDSTDLRVAATVALAELTLNGADPEEAGHMVPVQEPVATVTEALMEQLTDPESGVRVAAAGALTRLNAGAALDGAQPRAVQSLIDAGFAGEGQQARAMGRALRSFGAANAERPLLDSLAACENSRERRFAIEMLDELLRPEVLQTA